MFQRIGKLVSRWPLFWIGLWACLLVGLMLFAPDWDGLASEGELEHLPADSPSRVAGEMFQQAFPQEQGDSNIVLVLRRPEEPLLPRDYLFMAGTLVPRLQSIADKYGGVIEPGVIQRLEQTLFGAESSGDAAGGDEAGGDEAGAGDTAEPAGPEDPAADQEQNPDENLDEDLEEDLEESIERSIEESLEENLDGQASEQESGPASEQTSEQASEVGADTEGLPRVVSIAAPHNSPLGPLLVSKDGQAMLVLIHLTSSFLTSENTHLIDDVESLLDELRQSGQLPEGLELHITGSAILGRDVISEVTKSINAVQNWTLWLVLALLLATFRAPLVSLIPLVTLFVALQVSLDLVAALAGGGVLEIYDGLQIYMTVLVYGAGVDYSMFLISRYREELDLGAGISQGLVIAITKVGFAIVISAGTEVVGLGTLAFAQFGKFQQAGTSIPLGLIITLLASMTLTVALLRLVGRWGFWPLRVARRPAANGNQGDQPPPEHDVVYRAWQWIGRQVQSAPLIVIVGGLVVTLPLIVVAVRNDDNLTYDITSGLPDDSPSLDGTAVLQEHFSQGIIGPVTILLQSDEIDFSSPEGLRKLSEISANLLESGQDFEVADLRVLVYPLGTSPRARQFLELIEKSIPSRWERIQQQVKRGMAPASPDLDPLPELEEIVLNEAKRYYVSQSRPFARHLTRLTLVLSNDPFSRESIASIDKIENRISSALQDDSVKTYILGPTASLNDIRTVAERDRSFMRIYVTLAVFAILVLLLRQLIVSVYLVLTVLLTYFTTMGITYLLFEYLEGESFVGLQWTVPVLLFTLLMAVGADYNVLVVQRYEEEKAEHGAGEGVVRALAATGGLISGAGFVMAGTFLALNLGGTMIGMQQLGFALACGVLIDTFLVRPLLVPPFLVLKDRVQRRLQRRKQHRRKQHQQPTSERTETPPPGTPPSDPPAR